LQGEIKEAALRVKYDTSHDEKLPEEPVRGDYVWLDDGLPAGAKVLSTAIGEGRIVRGNNWYEPGMVAADNLSPQKAALLLTRSEEGMTLFSDEGVLHAAAVAREVYDVSGAGDTVIATLAVIPLLARHCGRSLPMLFGLKIRLSHRNDRY